MEVLEKHEQEHDVLRLPPPLVVHAELRVLQAIVGMGLLVLEPQELPRDAFPPQLRINDRPVGLRAPSRAALIAAVELLRLRLVVQRHRQRPAQPRCRRTLQHVMHTAVPYSQTPGDRADAESL